MKIEILLEQDNTLGRVINQPISRYPCLLISDEVSGGRSIVYPPEECNDKIAYLSGYMAATYRYYYQ